MVTGLRDMFLSDTEGSEHSSLPTSTRRYAQNKTGKTKIKQTKTDQKKTPYTKKRKLKKVQKKKSPKKKNLAVQPQGPGKGK